MPDMLGSPGLSRAEAIAVQRELAGRVERATRLHPVSIIAGVDCAAPRFLHTIRAQIVLLSWPELALVEHRQAELPSPLPYIPGLLSFRELPAVLAAWEQVTHQPQLAMVDGQGIAHPRRLGIASHLGVALDIPTIGVAKSVLTGEPRHGDPGPEPGNRLDLFSGDERVGALLRTRRRSKPLVISTGHRVSLDDAIAWVLRCSRGYRLPEPTRLADAMAGA